MCIVTFSALPAFFLECTADGENQGDKHHLMLKIQLLWTYENKGVSGINNFH